jgi:peroxisomal 3,2-trans-enoyl-CoA isomerase
MTNKVEKSSADQCLILTHKQDGVTTLTMNNPGRLNGWTLDMMAALKEGFRVAARDDGTKVLVLTGAGPYYCAGVNLVAIFQFAHPRKLQAMIKEYNQALFDMFLDFPKPLLIAINGPAIGASVTSATLADAIIASDKATFSTPFAALGVTPEGCSSVLFSRIMGDVNAQRMLGKEGWKPTAKEALEVGLIQGLSPHDKLTQEVHRIAQKWIVSGAKRSFRAGCQYDDLKAINARESEILSKVFFAVPFIKSQIKFLWHKKKLRLAAMFLMMLITRPLWSRLL